MRQGRQQSGLLPCWEEFWDLVRQLTALGWGGDPGESWREGGDPSRLGVPSSAGLAASGLLQG